MYTYARAALAPKNNTCAVRPRDYCRATARLLVPTPAQYKYAPYRGGGSNGAGPRAFVSYICSSSETIPTIPGCRPETLRPSSFRPSSLRPSLRSPADGKNNKTAARARHRFGTFARRRPRRVRTGCDGDGRPAPKRAFQTATFS